MSYCTVEDVLEISPHKPRQFGYKDGDAEAKFNALIEKWIRRSESHINAYCRRNWYPYIEDGVEITPIIPDAVSDVCARLTANIIVLRFGRNELPLKEVENWDSKLISSEIFTEDLRQDLKPFRKPRKINIFKI